ncbi:MAG: hypothetical protein ABEH43_08490 [Flavobacteriales bacterium]
MSDKDDVKTSLEYMIEYNVHHLSVLHDSSFLGLLDYSSIKNRKNEEVIADMNPELINAAVYEDKHLYDVINQACESNVTLIAVLDEEDNYKGSISLNDLMVDFAEISSIKEPGGIIILNISDSNYSMSEISQIIEGNDARILSSYITSFPENRELEVTIKVNKTELDGIIQTFERYEYTIKQSFHESIYEEDLKHKYEELMHYLNM